MTITKTAGQTTRDLTDSAQNQAVLDEATELFNHHGRAVIGLDRETEVFGASPVYLEALRCAASKARLVDALNALDGFDSTPKEPVVLSVVWAMYGETARLQPRSDNNPHGEDFLRAKVAQARWLAEGTSLEWRLIAVDDGCRDEPSSFTAATELAASEGWGNVTVLRLADALGAGHEFGRTYPELTSPTESRKGGSILYGLWHATRSPVEGHQLCLYTDADLSANIAQAGLLVAPLLGGAAGAIGQRYGLPGSVLVKESGPMTEPESTGSKPDKMIILFRHYVRTVLLADLASVYDTQAGFKAFDAAGLQPALTEMETFDETFDVELLLHLTRHHGSAALAVEPIVFTEDFAQTNFPSIDPGQRHFDMIGQVVNIYDRFVAPHTDPDREQATLLGWCRQATLDDYIAVIEALRSAAGEAVADSVNADRPRTIFEVQDSLGERDLYRVCVEGFFDGDSNLADGEAGA